MLLSLENSSIRDPRNEILPGQYYDSETGLHYNMARDYDPQGGRYIQSDPIGINGGINTYAYANSNPISFVDPLGLAVTWKGSVWSFGATAGIGGQFIRFKLESECKCNRKYEISGFASMLTVGAGAKFAKVGNFLSDASGAGGPAEFLDPFSDCPDPDAATGFATSSGASVVPGYGGSLLPRMDLGRLSSWGFASGPSYGVDFSIQSSIPFLGRSAVTSVKKTECCSN